MKLYRSINDFSEIPSLIEWQNQWEKPDEMDWLNFIGFNICPEHILIFSKLLFPDFVEDDGCIFLAIKYNEKTISTWRNSINTVCDLEKFINHVHLYDVFAHSKNLSDTILIELASILKLCWETALSRNFITKSFDIIITNTEADYGPTITFCQKNYK